MRFAVLFVVLSAVLAVAGLYVHRRASGTFGLRPRARKLLGAAIFAGMGATLLGRAMSSTFAGAIAEQVSVAGSMVSLAVIVSAVLLLGLDGANGLGWLARRTLTRTRARARADTDTDTAAVTATDTAAVTATDTAAVTATDPAAVTATDTDTDTATATDTDTATALPRPPVPGTMPRRAFLGRAAAGGALFVGSSSSFYGALFGRHDYQLEEVAIAVRGLARTLDGLTIVQISDIHFGMFVGEPELRAAVALVRRARPDLVVITGDMLDHDARFAPLLGKLVRALEPLPRYGVAVVAGNHDHYAGVDEVLATARAAGATVLRNSARVIGDRGGAFALVGVDDLWARRLSSGHGPDLRRALAMAPAGLPRVLLCHNPAFFPEASNEVALQLSGHTHGGQVNVGVRLADYVLPFGYVAGLYERDGARLWVNRGFGTAGPPARVGAPPEVTRVRLVAA